MEYNNISQKKFSLKFNDPKLEKQFNTLYDQDVKRPLRYGLIISVLSWFAATLLIYIVIPEKLNWLAPLTITYIGSYFGFVIYATYFTRFSGYYQLLGAISNVWAGLYAIYFCHQFPEGFHLTLPVIIFIIFFGSYLVKLRWFAGFIAAASYVLAYSIYITIYADATINQIVLYTFVSWMTLIFAVLAGRITESSNRISFTQKMIIAHQNEIIEGEKKFLLQEVHHRVQNNLQIIVSLLNLQISYSDQEKAHQPLSEARNRVLSMSLIHKQVRQTSNSSEISLHNYTRSLIENLNSSFSGSNNGTIAISESLTLNIDKSITLGLILNEIISNFHLHSDNQLPTTKKFKIEIFQNELNNTIQLRYSDNGVGFSKEALKNDSDTLGLMVITSLAEQLDAQFNFSNNSGAIYEISFQKD